MAGVKGKSGRKPRRLEERKLIGRHFKAAVTVVCEMLTDKTLPPAIRFDAARLIIEQHIGRAPQQINTQLTGAIVVTNADLEQALLEVRAYNERLLATPALLEKGDATEQETGQGT